MAGRARITTEGLKDLQRDLRAVDRKLVTEVGGAMRNAADPIVTEAKQLAPHGHEPIPETRVPPKRLADTIKASRRGLTIGITAQGPHAAIVHDGGRHPVFGNRRVWVQVRPRPFITTAIDEHADQVADSMADAVEQTLDRNGFTSST